MKLMEITEENKQTKIIIKKKIILLPGTDLHKGSSICPLVKEEHSPRHASTQEPSTGNTTLQGGEINRQISVLWKLPEVGTQGAAVRRQDKVRILFRKPRHKGLQGENRGRRQCHTQVSKVFSEHSDWNITCPLRPDSRQYTMDMIRSQPMPAAAPLSHSLEDFPPLPQKTCSRPDSPIPTKPIFYHASVTRGHRCQTHPTDLRHHPTQPDNKVFIYTTKPHLVFPRPCTML